MKWAVCQSLIAEYLARTEPHSPVPYLIKRGVEWGNKPLSEMLGELIWPTPNHGASGRCRASFGLSERVRP